MGKTVKELDEELTPEEITDWYIYMGREPRGLARIDFLMAHALQQMVSCWSSKRYTIKDAMVQFKTPDQLKTEEELEEHTNKVVDGLILFAKQHNAALKRKRK